MLGRAAGLGALTGGAIGVCVMVTLGVRDVPEYDAAALLAIAIIYLPFAFVVGALAGLAEALVALTTVVLVAHAMPARPPSARLVAATAAAVPGVVAVAVGAPRWFALGFALVAAGAAAWWMPRVIGVVDEHHP